MYAQCKVFHCHGDSIEARVNQFLREKELSLDLIRLTVVPPPADSDLMYVVLWYDEEQPRRSEGGKKF